MDDSPEEYQRKMKNRKDLILRMNDVFICKIHNERIRNWKVNPKENNYEIYFETCCKEFADIIDNEMMNYPLQ